MSDIPICWLAYYLANLKKSRVVSCSSLVELQMCTEERKHLYLGLRFRRYFLWLVLSQKAREKTLISFQLIFHFLFILGRRHDSCNSERYSRNKLRCNASCWSQFTLLSNIPSHILISSISNPAWHFGSRISTFSCSIFSIRHLLIRLGLGLSYWQCHRRDFDRIYTVRILSLSFCFSFASTNRFDPEKHGVPHSTYYLDSSSPFFSVVYIR